MSVYEHAPGLPLAEVASALETKGLYAAAKKVRSLAFAASKAAALVKSTISADGTCPGSAVELAIEAVGRITAEVAEVHAAAVVLQSQALPRATGDDSRP